MDLTQAVPNSLKRHPAIKSVELAGSRKNNSATPWSDWDFTVETADFNIVSAALPGLTHNLERISYLWDPLYDRWIFMMILKGPVKVDLIFDIPHQLDPPWPVNSDTLQDINSHFWDWIFWIGGKQVRGLQDMVNQELQKMYSFLLTPLGVTARPNSVEEAVRLFLSTFHNQKFRFHQEIDPALETEVLKGLMLMGFNVWQDQ
ncbi:MAG TPA: hypothetical protein VHO70_09005 [Chitinispirillaceae bacterium]|nr:hypothetical protein [Chitinispirillaceae bacterium]